jgi:hypothetical protein
MTTEFKASAKHDPWFGVLSVTAPFISLPLSIVVFLPLLGLTPIVGVGCAVAAWIRHEKQWALPWIGLLLNLALLFFLFRYAFL